MAKPKLIRNTTTLLLLTGVLLSSNFKELEIKGLSSTRILSTSQDSSGFFWIGTDEGLNRYDGYFNKVYRSNISDDRTISGNRIWITYVDKSNSLWVATDRGICSYNKESDTFSRIETDSRPVHVLEHKRSLYFTTTKDGIFRIDKQTKEITRYRFDPLDPFSLSSSRFSEKQTSPIVVDGETIWVGTTNGLNKIDIKTGQTKRLYSGKTSLVKGDTITSVLVSGDRLFVGSTDGLGISDIAFGEGLNKNLGKSKSSYIRAIFEIEETEQVCVVSAGSVEIFKKGDISQSIKTHKDLNKITNLTTGQYLITSKTNKNGLFLAPGKTGKLIDKKIETPIVARSLLVDAEFGIWMAGDEGIVRAGNTKSPVTTIEKVKTSRGSFSRQGTNVFILEKNKILSLDENWLPKPVVVAPEVSTGLNKKIYVSNKKNIYFFDKKLEQLNKDGSLATLAVFKSKINRIIEEKENIYISLENSGIAKYSKNTGETVDYRKNRLLSKLLPAGASSFLIDGKTLWVGSDESGLYELDLSDMGDPKTAKHHKYDKTNPRSFSSSSVSSIIKHSGLLFIGTSGDGLFLYKNDGFDRVTIQEGLPSNNIVSLAGSSDTTIWSLTNGGLALINFINNNISVVGPEEGLNPFFKDDQVLIPRKDGNVDIISPGGLQNIKAQDLYTNEHEAVVVVESVELIDKNNKRHPIKKKNIKSTHTKPIIKVNLTAPSMFKAGKTTFSYFIKGYHDKWIDNGERRYIEIQGLSAGSYELQVRSYNSDGYESKNIASINFQIIPPWWQTWWAYFLYASTVLGLFAYYVAYQKKAQEKASEQKRKEEELEQARQFQLDMLPRETPDELGLDISATIETASEVGGDYYDYFPQKDKKSLYVVVGDATGHGMTAGMMVSITKAGLYGIPESTPPNDVARQLNRVIKNIDLGWNRMAFNMARFWDDRVEFTSAAMPPVYHYHNTTGELDEVLLGGLPLGSIKDESFVLEEFGFNHGDSLVFISDGLPEAENKEGEMLGYDAVYSCIKANGGLSAEEQKQALLDLGSAWLGELQNQDDITIVVVKKSNPLE